MRLACIAGFCLLITGLCPRIASAAAPAASPAARAPAGATRVPHVPSTPLRILHSTHYRIHTDLDRNLTEDLSRRMDAMYEEYSRRLASFDANHSGDKFDVFLFAKRKNYLDFTGNKMSNAGGVTIPDINCVAADLESQGRDALRATLQHEAFHQFAASVISQDLPPWINEGLAVMFQEGIWTGRSFMLGQVPPRRVRQLQKDIADKRLIDFNTMLNMKLSSWNTTLDSDRVAASTQYTQAWAMCHFLVYATENGQYKYRARFLDLLQRIHAGTDSMEAFKIAFSPNVEGFQKKFLAWAKTLGSTPEATLIEHHNVLADMLTTFASEGKRFGTMNEFRKMLVDGGYQMQYTVNDLKWVTDANPKIYFNDLAGKPYQPHEQYFELHGNAPMPDFVCDPVGQIHLRTRFYDAPGGKVERETLVEGGGNGR